MVKKILITLASLLLTSTALAQSCIWTDDPKGPSCSIIPQKSTVTLGDATHPFGGLALSKTVTATGTTGNQTINKASGTVNIAASADSVVVTDSLVTTSSIVLTTIRTADATLTFIKSAVPANGSFTITGNTTATAETSIGFLVIN